jgi:hypothetical protein
MAVPRISRAKPDGAFNRSLRSGSPAGRRLRRVFVEPVDRGVQQSAETDEPGDESTVFRIAVFRRNLAVASDDSTREFGHRATDPTVNDHDDRNITLMWLPHRQVRHSTCLHGLRADGTQRWHVRNRANAKKLGQSVNVFFAPAMHAIRETAWRIARSIDAKPAPFAEHPQIGETGLIGLRFAHIKQPPLRDKANGTPGRPP